MWLGVDEDSGLYVLIAGIVLLGLTFLACVYCKVYDPIKLWCIKMHKKHCTKKPKEPAAKRPGTPSTPEVRPTCPPHNTMIYFRKSCLTLIPSSFSRNYIGAVLKGLISSSKLRVKEEFAPRRDHDLYDLSPLDDLDLSRRLYSRSLSLIHI